MKYFAIYLFSLLAIFLGPIHANPVRYLSNESPSKVESIEQDPDNFQKSTSQSIKDFNSESLEKDEIASSLFEAIAQKASGLWELKQHLAVFGSEALEFTPELSKLKEFFKRSEDDENDDNGDENEEDDGDENEEDDGDENEEDDGDENNNGDENDDNEDDDGEDDDGEDDDDDNNKNEEDENDGNDNEEDDDTASNYEKGNGNPVANPGDWTCKGCDEWTSHADDCDEDSPNYSECVKHGVTVISTTTKTVNMIKPTTYTVTKPGTVSTVYSTLIRPTTVSLTTTRYRTRRIHNTVTFTPSSIHTSFSPYNIVEQPSSIIPESSSQTVSGSVTSSSSVFSDYIASSSFDPSTTSSSSEFWDTFTISSSFHSTHSRHHRIKTITKFDTTAISTMWDTVTVTTATTTTMTPISSNRPSISRFVGINFSSFNATVSLISSLDSSSKVEYGFGNGINQTDKTAGSVTTPTSFSANSFSTKVSFGSTDVRVDNTSTLGLFNQTYSTPLTTNSSYSLTSYHENFNHTIGASSIAQTIQTEEQFNHDKPIESTTNPSDVTTTMPTIIGDQFTSFPINRTEQTGSIGSLLKSDISHAFFNHTIQTVSSKTFPRVDPMTTSFPSNSVKAVSSITHQLFNQTVVIPTETSKISFPLLNQTAPNLFAKPGFNHTIATSTLEDTFHDTLTPSVLPLSFTHTLVDSSESTSLATQPNLASSNQDFPFNQTISTMASSTLLFLDNGSAAPVHSNAPLFNHTTPNFNKTILSSPPSSTLIRSSLETVGSEISSFAGKKPYSTPMNQTVKISGSGIPISSSGLLFNHTIPSIGFFNISHFNETANTFIGFNRTIFTSAVSQESEPVDTIHSALHSGGFSATASPVFTTSNPDTGKRINQIDTVYSDIPMPANLTADHNKNFHSDVSQEPSHIFLTPPMFNVTYGTRPKPMDNPLDSVPASVASSFTTDLVSEATSSEISSFVPITGDLDTVSSVSPGTVSHSHSRRTIYIDITVTTTLSMTTLHRA